MSNSNETMAESEWNESSRGHCFEVCVYLILEKVYRALVFDMVTIKTFYPQRSPKIFLEELSSNMKES